MKSFTIILFCCLSSFAFSQKSGKSESKEKSQLQQVSKKTYLISSPGNLPFKYNQFSILDIQSGKSIDEIYSPKTNCDSRGNEYQPYKAHKEDKEEDSLQTPSGGSIASMAYDYKSNRLFYVPLQLSELRYLDLKESKPSFTYLRNQSLNLLHNKEDVANQISRMTIGMDGFGYALTNDGEHLIKFNTQGNPTIQDLGVLIDNPKNQVLVRSSCTSWGGDMVADINGNLYLVTARNHVFKVSLPSKKCDYIGMIKNLPEGFSSNGASVDEGGNLLVSCGAALGKSFSPIYKIRWSSLEAEPVGDNLKGIGNISDMASSNLLFQKEIKEKELEIESKSINITSKAVIESDNNLPNITLFPNPVTHGRFQIKTNNLKEKGVYRMMVLDVLGQPIMEGKMNLGLKSNTNTFNFPSRYAKGVYVIQISDIFNRTVYSQQMIVE